MMLTKTFLLASGLVALSEAHMVMNTPVPYDFNGARLTNGPMAANGIDFPCKLGPGMTFKAGSAPNQMALGSTQPLKFTGSAVHGGGTCQVSLTTDANPTKNSVWKVITSIEGGCPARGEKGNLPDKADGADPYTYTFAVPRDIPSGNYTLAWTWFNKIGNREMYMNCAPAALTGTGGSKANFDALPDMFVANIGNGCTVPDNKDAKLPNPGNNLQRLNGATDAFAAPTGTGCQTGSGSGGGPPGAPTSLGAAIPSIPMVEPTPASAAPTDSDDPGVFITEPPSVTGNKPPASPPPVSSPTNTPETTPTSPSSPNVSASASSAAGAPSSASSTNGSASSAAGAPKSPSPTNDSGPASGALSGPCATEGQWNCIAGKQFQRCASGHWSTAMPLAAGTKCEAGQSSAIQITAARLVRRVAKQFRS